MGTKLDQQTIQCLTIFARVAGVRTKDCFTYNRTMIFVVNRNMLPRAVGEKGKNVRKMSALLRTKVRVISSSDLENFVKDVIQPIKFKKFIVADHQATIFAGQQAKASLIGRNKVRLNELSEILKRYFNVKTVRIV